MPVTQGGPVQDLADQLNRTLSGGTPARATLGAKDAAFAWTTGTARGFWSVASTVSVDGPGFTALIVRPTGTPVGKVAEGATKPTAVNITSAPHTLQKWAGLASFTMEKAVYSDVLPAAVVATLINGALAAFDVERATTVVADAGDSISGSSSWTSAILGAVGTIASNGGQANVLALNPADFAAAIEGTPPSLNLSGADAVLSYLGLEILLSPGLAAGTGVVFDRRAVLVAESSASPSVVVDPYSSAESNTVRVVADLMAAVVVTSPGAVVSIVPTLAPLAAGKAKS